MAKKFMAFEINAPDGQNYVFEKDEVAKFCQVYDGIVLSHNCVEVINLFKLVLCRMYSGLNYYLVTVFQYFKASLTSFKILP